MISDHTAPRDAVARACRCGAAALMLAVVASGCSRGAKTTVVKPSKLSEPRSEEWLRKSLDAEKTPALMLSFGELMEDQNRLDMAREQYEQLVAMEGQTTGKWRDKRPVVSAEQLRGAELGLARLAGTEGRDGEAIRGFDAVLKLAPNDPRTLQSYGQYQLTQGRLGEAESLLRRAVAADAKNADAKLALGTTLIRTGRGSQAKPLFIAALGPEKGTHAFARSLMKAGDRVAARFELERLLQANPGNAAVRQELSAVTTALAAEQRSSRGTVRRVGHRQANAAPRQTRAPQQVTARQQVTAPQRMTRQQAAPQRMSAPQSSRPLSGAANPAPQRVQAEPRWQTL